MSDQWSKYAWRDEELNDDLMSGCLGVVVGVEEAKVRELLAVDEGSRRNATVHDAWRLSESDFGNDLVQISSIGHAIVTFEPNGWHGVGYELAAALSRNGRYAAYFWNVNALMQFVFAEAGEVKRDFDPLLYDNDGARGEGPARRDGSPIPPSDGGPLTPGRASLALIERLTGIETTREWLLDEPHATYRVDPE